MTSSIRTARRFAPLCALLLLLVLPSPAAAHAELLRAIPADGETVTEPVGVVSGRYTEDLIRGSHLEIKAADGTTVATGGIDPDDDRRMVARPEAPLADGTFTVESTALSVDGHVERVQWTFTVAEPASPTPTSSPEATPSPDGSPSASPTEEPSASASPSASPAPGAPTSGTGDVLLPIIAALAIVALGAGLLLSRSRSRPG